MYDITKIDKDELMPKNEAKALKAIAENVEYRDFIENLSAINLKYMAGMMEVKTKIEILNEDLKIRYNYNPIKSIQTRLKTPESIIKKMNKMNLDVNINNLKNNIRDVAGVRIICKYVPDIFKIVEMIKGDSDLIIIKEKDYVNNPKESGYRSYHLIVKIPINLTTGKEVVPVEIQIRTMSMDFWASLEHELVYKYNGTIPEDVAKEMVDTSIEVMKLDEKMYKIKEIILKNNE